MESWEFQQNESIWVPLRTNRKTFVLFIHEWFGKWYIIFQMSIVSNAIIFTKAPQHWINPRKRIFEILINNPYESNYVSRTCISFDNLESPNKLYHYWFIGEVSSLIILRCISSYWFFLLIFILDLAHSLTPFIIIYQTSVISIAKKQPSIVLYCWMIRKWIEKIQNLSDLIT